ncbi:MAG TPA: hypothetical protein VIL35_06735 [Vicinamibacterales bacterium]
MGARARLESLRAETAALLAAFPELARGSGGRAAAASAGNANEASAAPRKRRRRRYTMTPEQKQAVSERMKKYWAARRKEKARGN